MIRSGEKFDSNNSIKLIFEKVLHPSHPNEEYVGCTFLDGSQWKIRTYKNQSHQKNRYLQLIDYSLNTHHQEVFEFFKAVHDFYQQDLQIIIKIKDHAHLISKLRDAGFRGVRHTKIVRFDLEKAKPLMEQTVLERIKRGSNDFIEASALLFNYYQKTHESINPYSLNLEAFMKQLPDEYWVEKSNGEIVFCASFDQEELAYLASKEMNVTCEFSAFLTSLISELIKEFSIVECEIDDTCPLFSFMLVEFAGVARICEEYATFLWRDC